MKLKLLVSVSIVGIVLFLSCKHEIPVIPPGTHTVCFEEDVLPLFQSNCAKSGCHDTITAQNDYRLNSYENIIAKGIIAGDSSHSRLYEMITRHDDSIMPPSPNRPLADSQIHIIAKWISEGAANTRNCAPACDSTKFTYSGAIRPILETHCLGCHSDAAPDGGYIPLDTYDGVKEQVTFDKLYPAITHTGDEHMPKNGNKLNDCKIRQIKKWIDAGALND